MTCSKEQCFLRSSRTISELNKALNVCFCFAQSVPGLVLVHYEYQLNFKFVKKDFHER